MTAGTPSWDETLRGPAWADEAQARLRSGRHREDADRRRVVVAAGAGVGAGLAALLDAVGGSRTRLKSVVTSVPVDVLLQGLAVALLVAGAIVLMTMRRRRLLVPAWTVGGVLIGAGMYGMVEGFVRHTVGRATSDVAYLWFEALAAAVIVAGSWTLRHPRAHSR